MIVPMVLVILMITFATLVRTAQMPVWTAASECAREGIASASETIGRRQAENAALKSLAGYAIDPTSVQVKITGDWTLDSTVSCYVGYNIDTSKLAFFAELTGGHVSMAAEVTLHPEPHKSRWQ